MDELLSYRYATKEYVQARIAEAMNMAGSGGAALPTNITKIDGGTFTFPSDMLLTTWIPHGLGVVPRAVIIWTEDTEANKLFVHDGSLIRTNISAGTVYTLLRIFDAKDSATAASASGNALVSDYSPYLTATEFCFNHSSKKYGGGTIYNWIAFA